MAEETGIAKNTLYAITKDTIERYPKETLVKLCEYFASEILNFIRSSNMKFMYGQCKADKSLKGIILFAQFIDEMIYDHTPDTYKAYALNIHTTLLELASMIADYQDMKITSRSLEHVFEELRDKLQHDPVIKGDTKTHYSGYVEKIIESSKDKNTIKYYVDAFISEINLHYWDELREMILESLKDDKNKYLIRDLVNAFICENEIRGYSREYIYTINRRFFFDDRIEPSSINSIDQINDFLSFFELEEKDYTVIYRVSKDFLEIKELAKTYTIDIEIENIFNKPNSLKAKGFLGKSRVFPYYAKVIIKSEDWITAKKKADHFMSALIDMYYFHNINKKLRWERKSLVIDGNNEYIVRQQNPAIRKGGINDALHILPWTLKLLSSNSLDNSSKYTFINSLSLHRAAIKAQSPTNELLDLWAATESFLPAPDAGSTRITHYIDYLSPFLTVSYSCKLFEYLLKLISFNENAINLLSEISPKNNQLIGLMKLIVCEDLKTERMKLYNIFDDNPLTKFRCFVLHKQFKSAKNTLDTIANHKKRVNLHIQRIYSTRNQIMHNARALPYLDTLIENMHSYLDTLILNTITISYISDTIMSIGSCAKKISVFEETHLKLLTEKKEVVCNTDNFFDIVVGSSNPVAPYLYILPHQAKSS